jgi:hypothetical protein
MTMRRCALMLLPLSALMTPAICAMRSRKAAGDGAARGMAGPSSPPPRSTSSGRIRPGVAGIKRGLRGNFEVDDAVIRAILDGRKYRDVSPQTGVV